MEEKGEKLVTVTFRIPENLHRSIKIHTAEQGVTIKDYLVTLIQADLEASKKTDK